MKISANRQYTPFILAIGGLLLALLILLLLNIELNALVFVTIAWVIIISALLYFGNKVISIFLNKELPWNEYLTLRFFVQLLASLIYALICINISYLIFKVSFTQDPPSPEQVFLVNMYSVFLVLPVFSIYYVVYFIKQWKQTKVETEQLQKEQFKSELNNLKNHLDPHFLFNNLNILSSLLEKDGKESQKYLDNFAEVYRYMLQNKSKELIPLSQELAFIDSYMHLIKMRYQDTLIFDVDVSREKLGCHIPPLTIQMLLENCVKHNVLTDENPLEIKIMSNHGNYLEIRNNITGSKLDYASSGSGLNNIKNRYRFYTDQKMQVENNGRHFSVKIPLLEIEEE